MNTNRNTMPRREYDANRYLGPERRSEPRSTFGVASYASHNARQQERRK